MPPNSTARADADGEGEVMAAVSGERLVIADISRDDAWLSIPVAASVSVDEFR
jgi:hypothetical protein